MPVQRKFKSNCQKFILGTVLYILVVLFLLFIILFVILPVTFKYSIGIQRNLIFPTFAIPLNVNYSDIDKFGIKGVKNFYVDVNNFQTPNESEKIILGVWQILPLEMLSELVKNEDYNFDGALKNEKYNVLIYLHGNGQDRTDSIEKYLLLRKYFHIFAVDYRGYADSTKATLTETAIVDDLIGFYEFLRNQTNSKIFVWGHSLGTGVSTHMLAKLKDQKLFAKGLILEAPFTSVTDVMESVLGSLCNWLPWLRSTVLQPMIDNDFNFDLKKYIVNVDCPILILHAKDDTIIDYSFGVKLYNIAISNRSSTNQGQVTLNIFDALGYDHMDIYRSPKLPALITQFVNDSEKFEKKIV